MISIVSGPTCVGKTYFMENKKDRILELNNLPPTMEFHATGSISSTHLEFPEVVSHWKKRNDGGAIVDQLICIHHNRLTEPQRTVLINTYKDNDDCFSKNVIILGIPYSEYKVRVQLRGKIHERLSRSRLLHTINRYKDWIDELNKNEIPYLLVEAIEDYKVLEEEEFFRMIK
jgi:hypothetical protein|tara:strand:- start:101 stop:619 length:519 start_codon:yes stop_codon:yes gene_type:complete